MPTVTFKGDPVTLSGAELKVGDAAPDFRLQNNGLEEISLATKPGRARILVSVPSLDTSVCAIETKKFNDHAKEMPEVDVYVISTDLPFAAGRFCGSEGIENVQTLSDHRAAEFGEKYGVLIQGGALDRILCRAIFVVGADDTIKHVEYVSEIAEEPNYDAALAAAKG